VKARPSDGKPVGSPFDYEEYLTRLRYSYEEYLTRLADRKASDPEYQKRLDAYKRIRRARWDKFREVAELRRANEAMAEGRIAKNRLHEIWNAVIADKMNQDWLRSAPLQAAIKAAPRIRGCGRAAAKAGF
jgi:hypothetical protein